MNNNTGIVRDVTQLNQAQTVTGPYQSPNGPATIIQGFTEAFAEAFGGRGRGSGESKDWSALDARTKALVAEIDTKGLEGSELESGVSKYFKDITALGFNYNDSETALKAYGLDKVFEAYRKPANVDRELTMNNLYWAGRAQKGPNATTDEYYSAGAESVSLNNSSMEVISKLSNLTPEQAEQYLMQGKAPRAILSAAIVDRYTALSRDPRNTGLGAAYVLNAAKTAEKNRLIAQGIPMATANALVEDALLPQTALIMGTEALQKDGLINAEKTAAGELKTIQDTQGLILLQEFSNMMFDKIGRDAKPGEKVSGRVLLADAIQQAQGGEDGQVSLLVALNNIKGTGYYDQFLKQYNDRHSYNTLGFVIDNGADLSDVCAKDPTACKNMGGMKAEAIDETLKQVQRKSYSELNDSDAQFQVPKNFLKTFVKSDGKKLSKEVVEGEYPTQADKDAQLNTVFEGIAAGANAATDDGGFYYIDSKGSLKYLVPEATGNRKAFENAVLSEGNVEAFQMLQETNKDTDVVVLQDASNRGEFIAMGDNDAVRMRNGFSTVKEVLSVFRDSFGYDMNDLVRRFNESQIRNSKGAQKARSFQLTQKWFGMNMNDDDVAAVLEMAEKHEDTVSNTLAPVGGAIVQGAKEAATGIPAGVIEAARLTGQAPGQALTAGAQAIRSAVSGPQEDVAAGRVFEAGRILSSDQASINRDLRDIVKNAKDVGVSAESNREFTLIFGPNLSEQTIKAPEEGTIAYIGETNTLNFTDTKGNTITFTGVTVPSGMSDEPLMVKKDTTIAYPYEEVKVVSDTPILSEKTIEKALKK